MEEIYFYLFLLLSTPLQTSLLHREQTEEESEGKEKRAVWSGILGAQEGHGTVVSGFSFCFRYLTRGAEEAGQLHQQLQTTITNNKGLLSLAKGSGKGQSSKIELSVITAHSS